MSTQAPFVVLAEFEVSSDNYQAFLDLCQMDSERSLADEPGCQRFDVNTANDIPGIIVLHEVYNDRAAFDTHLTMPHFALFAEGLKRLAVREVQVRFFTHRHP